MNIHSKHHRYPARATTSDAHIWGLSIGILRIHIMCESCYCMVPSEQKLVHMHLYVIRMADMFLQFFLVKQWLLLEVEIFFSINGQLAILQYCSWAGRVQDIFVVKRVHLSNGLYFCQRVDFWSHVCKNPAELKRESILERMRQEIRVRFLHTYSIESMKAISFELCPVTTQLLAPSLLCCS